MMVHLRIYGKVQGVFYRKAAKAEAEKLGLTGWIRNAEDGSVETIVSGKKEQVDEFVEWCKKGPELAQVERMDIKEVSERQRFKNFEIIE